MKKHTQRKHSKKVRRQNRTTVMRKVRKMLSDTELLREINRQKGKDATNGVIDETVIETIMSHIPLISNRSILKTLSILRKKLPKEIFKFRNPSRIICVMSKQLQEVNIHCTPCNSRFSKTRKKKRYVSFICGPSDQSCIKKAPCIVCNSHQNGKQIQLV